MKENWLESVIPSKNLRIALIDEVYKIRSGGEELYGLEEEYEEFREKHGGPPVDELGEEAEYQPQVEQFILQLPVTEQDLLSLENLTFDGDREAYAIVFPYWWDLGDQFIIDNLEGIDNCANLTKLNLGLVENASLSPLTNLKNLNEISLSYEGGFRDVNTLCKLDLKKVGIGSIPTSLNSEWKETLKTLRDRGVEFK